MAFRGDEGATRAKLESAQARLRAAEEENARLREELEGARSTELGIPRSARLWAGAAMLLLPIGGVLQAIGLPPPWDAFLPAFGVLSLVGFGIGVVCLVRVASPAEVLVVSGRKYLGPGGRLVGHRVIEPGVRVLAIPGVERVHRLDLAPIPLRALVSMTTKDGHAVRLEVSAAVAIDLQRIDEAVERFLGRPRAEIAQVARTALEGAARSVCAHASLEQLDRIPDSIAHTLTSAVTIELETFGLVATAVSLARVETG